ncbi:hypothetical protein Prudu_927S000300, partial [Prunus dulcis]
MEIEIEMIEKNETWELVDRPSDKPIIGVKWVYKTKLNLDGSIQKHKARLVVKGYAQKPGINFNETFGFCGQTRHHQNSHSISSSKGVEVIPEEVYVDQSDGFVVPNYEDKVYKLKKALYGLKQSPRAWYEEINAYLISCGYVRSTSEATLYCKTKEDSGTLIVSIYVDDIVYTGSSGELIAEFKSEMTRRFGLKQCKPVSTPLVASEKLCKDDGSDPVDESEYRQIVGKEVVLIGYCDSDWSGSQDDMRSTSGYAFCFGSGVYSWASIKQHNVALSTAEAEYVSASEATTQAIWLRFVLEDFGELQTDATPLMVDNTFAIAMTRNPVFIKRPSTSTDGVMDLRYCKSEEQVVDIFTKALPKDRFNYLRGLLGVKPVNNLEGNVEM